MGALRFALVLLAAFSLLFLAVPAEDLLGTAYDESEAVPYESTPLFSTALRQAARALQFSPILQVDLPPAFSDDAVRASWELTAHPVSGSLIILVCSLRC